MPPPNRGLLHAPRFVGPDERAELLAWLAALHPIWEERFSAHHPPPAGEPNRRLLRPVYWLGNWQFACLGYYHPPRGALHRCVRAEPFPPALVRLLDRVLARIRGLYLPDEVPKGWRLNTCLVNFYGDRLEGGRRVDAARVGDHRDYEPGPVASISFGERALVQFVERRGADVTAQQWLEDGALQVFGGDLWKRRLFHRVQRVDRKEGHRFPLHVEGFEARRINLTFRYVPEEHVVPFAELPPGDAEDVRGYVETLARHSPFWAAELAKRRD